ATQAYVRQLEQAYDATGDETLHPRRDDFNSEQLMHELEDFFARSETVVRSDAPHGDPWRRQAGLPPSLGGSRTHRPVLKHRGGTEQHTVLSHQADTPLDRVMFMRRGEAAPHEGCSSPDKSAPLSSAVESPGAEVPVGAPPCEDHRLSWRDHRLGQGKEGMLCTPRCSLACGRWSVPVS